MSYKDKLKNIKNIIFDFDDVIVDSMHIRTEGLEKYFVKLIEKLIEYNEVFNMDISENRIQEYAEAFGRIMKEKLTSKQILIVDTVYFIKQNYSNYNFHIASGSEERELQYLCKRLEIYEYFITIIDLQKLKMNW